MTVKNAWRFMRIRYCSGYSVMAGEVLKAEQVDSLRRDLLGCRDPFACPHGRPTVIEMPEKFIDRQFLRI